jgi:hypothetical protein
MALPAIVEDNGIDLIIDINIDPGHHRGQLGCQIDSVPLA